MICPHRWYEIERIVQTPTVFAQEPEENEDGTDTMFQSVCFDSITTTTKNYYDCETYNCASFIAGCCCRR